MNQINAEGSRCEGVYYFRVRNTNVNKNKEEDQRDGENEEIIHVKKVGSIRIKALVGTIAHGQSHAGGNNQQN